MQLSKTGAFYACACAEHVAIVEAASGQVRMRIDASNEGKIPDKKKTTKKTKNDRKEE